MSKSYKDAMHAAQEELAKLEARRESLVRLIASLAAVAEEERYELETPPGYIPQGLTEEIRTILRLTTVPLSPVEIRDHLIARGLQASSPKNLLISVHTVISRLYDGRELEVTNSGTDEKPLYRLRKTIGQMIAEGGGESWVGPGSVERSGMRGDEKNPQSAMARAMARKK